MKFATLLCALLLVSCSQVRQFALEDAGAAKVRAEKNGDTVGEMCWKHIEAQLLADNLDLDIKGIMDAVEAARVARLRGPELRQQITKNCGGVFADVIIEVARRARR